MLTKLLDSVILIDHLNRIEPATKYLLQLDPYQTAISVITRAEVLTGLDENNLASVSAMLDQYQILVIDRSIADDAAFLRRKHGWNLPDAFQAAIAQHHQISLVTRNTKDFNPKIYDFVEIPYSI
jgi:predicted nucleic acid-binding protein